MDRAQPDQSDMLMTLSRRVLSEDLQFDEILIVELDTKSEAVKYTQVEKYHNYQPVLIEHKSISVLDYNVTYRRGVNNDTEFYVEKANKVNSVSSFR